MSYVTRQYSRVGFYSSVEVNLSLYYGGVVYVIPRKVVSRHSITNQYTFTVGDRECAASVAMT